MFFSFFLHLSQCLMPLILAMLFAFLFVPSSRYLGLGLLATGLQEANGLTFSFDIRHYLCVRTWLQTWLKMFHLIKQKTNQCLYQCHADDNLTNIKRIFDWHEAVSFIQLIHVCLFTTYPICLIPHPPTHKS